MFKKKEIIVGI